MDEKYVHPLNAKNLETFTSRAAEVTYPHRVKVRDLDYPCNDKSSGVENFSDWSYFKKKKKMVYNTHSILWSKDLLQRVRSQANYDQNIVAWVPKESNAAATVKKTKFVRPNPGSPPRSVISKDGASDGGGSVDRVGQQTGTKRVELLHPHSQLHPQQHTHPRGSSTSPPRIRRTDVGKTSVHSSPAHSPVRSMI